MLGTVETGTSSQLSVGDMSFSEQSLVHIDGRLNHVRLFPAHKKDGAHLWAKRPVLSGNFGYR